jgi:hypothetical protein
MKVRGTVADPRQTSVFLYSKVSKRALMLIQFSIVWLSGLLPGGGRRPERDTDHSHPSNAVVKMREAINYSPRAFIARAGTLPSPQRKHISSITRTNGIHDD